MNIPVPHKLTEAFEKYDTFILIGHKEPDGDALSSQLALGSFLTRTGKKAIPVSPGPFDRREISDKEKYFKKHIPDGTDKKSALVVILDCSTLERIGYLAQEVKGFTIAVVDHHSSGQEFGDIRYIDPQAPSVTFMVNRIIETMGAVPTKEEAELLLFGLATDTGFFRHLEEGSAEVFKTAGKLVEAGSSPKRIFNEMYGNRTFESRKLLGILLSRAEKLCGGRIILTVETEEDVKTFGKENRDSDTLYQLLSGVEKTEAVILLRYENREEISVGLRSTGDIDVGSIAKGFGGGGHKKAAGFSSEKSFDEIKKDLMKEFCSRL